MKHPLLLVIFVATLGLAAAAPAAITDFKIKGDGITLSNAPGRLAVTPDDRFVLVLEPAAKKIEVVDTWDWTLVQGSIALTGTPSHIIISQSNKAYVTMDNGKVAQVDLSGLSTLGLSGSLSDLATPLPSTDISISNATALGDIAATSSCVFLLDGATVKWFREGATTTVNAYTTIPNCTNCLAREVEASGDFAYVSFEDINTGMEILEGIYCTATEFTDGITPMTLGTNGTVIGLSFEEYLFWFLASVPSEKALMIIGPFASVGETIEESKPYTQAMGTQDLLAIYFSAETSLIALALNDSALLLAQIQIIKVGNNYNLDFSPDPIISLPVSGGVALAHSSTIDQYVYLSSSSGNAVKVVTANPWVEIISAEVTNQDSNCVTSGISGCCSSQGGVCGCNATTGMDKCCDGTDSPTCHSTATTGTNQGFATIQFQSDQAGSCALYLGNTYAGLTNLNKPNCTVQANVAHGETVGLSRLTSGQNVITVTVTATAGSRIGRNAVAVNPAGGSSLISFSLSFGDRKLIVEFKPLNRDDVDHYVIFYDKGSTLATCADLESTNKGTVVVSSFEQNEKIQKSVDKLNNGATYYVQIAAKLDSGGCLISEQKSVLLENVQTLTELAGEDGGFDCLGLIGPGNGFGGSGVGLVAAPLLGLILMRLARKWRRGR